MQNFVLLFAFKMVVFSSSAVGLIAGIRAIIRWRESGKIARAGFDFKTAERPFIEKHCDN